MQLNPRRTALAVMDFQGNILATLPNPDMVVSKVVEAIAVTRNRGGIVAFVRIAFTPDELVGFPSHSALGQRMKAYSDKVLTDSPLTQIDSRLAPKQSDLSVRKRRIGPFSTTDLNERLKAAGAETLVFAGIQSSGCVLSGVREAYDLDYQLIVLSDACADPDQKTQDFLMGTIFPKQASVMTVEAYSRALEAYKD